mmetsp:Transcript_17825/g.53438  ORF Transcript_17825/g.53438 Transcript_17825/m.53438 type:complete len:136 (-) Transcript_17825:355-762(-)|eukprot:357833-Chlamydomonas_euryale.AAC.6
MQTGAPWQACSHCRVCSHNEALQPQRGFAATAKICSHQPQLTYHLSFGQPESRFCKGACFHGLSFFLGFKMEMDTHEWAFAAEAAQKLHKSCTSAHGTRFRLLHFVEQKSCALLQSSADILNTSPYLSSHTSKMG